VRHGLAEQTATGITFLGSRHQAPFSSWARLAQITSTLGFTTVEVPLAGGQIARLAGVTRRKTLKDGTLGQYRATDPFGFMISRNLNECRSGSRHE
jgi:hypothetical protein